MLIRKKLKIALLLLLVPALVLLMWSLFGRSEKERGGVPGIYKADSNTVEIRWESEDEYRAELIYYAYRNSEDTGKSIKEESRARSHRLEINHISSGKKFSYSIPALSDKIYHFRTRPDEKQLFKFGIMSKLPRDTAKARAGLQKVFTQNSEFIITGRQVNSEAGYEDYQEKTKEVKPYLQVYPVYFNKAYKVDKRFFTGLYANMDREYYSFNWGAWHMVCLPQDFLSGSKGIIDNKLEWLEKDLAREHSLNKMVFIGGFSGRHISLEELDKSGLNVIFSKARISAVWLLDTAEYTNINKHGIRYISLAEDDTCLVEAGKYEAAGSLLDDRGEAINDFTIKDVPLEIMRSCKYCRLLMDYGKYQESIKAYREFIAEGKDKHLIDDSMFELASIYDRKLFEYSKAVKEYNKLIEAYPKGMKSMMARRRLKYIEKHSEYNYEPLSRFEKIKSDYSNREGAREKRLQGMITEVEAIIEQFPENTIKEEMFIWIATTYRGVDLDKAIESYWRIIKTFPESQYVPIAYIKIAEVLYMKEDYSGALDFIEKHRQFIPEKRQGEVDARINSAKRNRNRGWFHWLAWLIVLAALGLAIYTRPALRFSDFRVSLLLFIVYTLGGAGYIALNYEVLRFYWDVAIIAALSFSMVPFVSKIITGKLCRFKIMAGIGLNIVLTVCVFYIIMFQMLFHDLSIYGI